MDLVDITPLILTFNEAANIARTLQGVAWAREIVVVDSGSTDGTLDILARYPAVRVERRPFDNFASQCNFGLTLITTPWTLSIDADYVCPPQFERELRSLTGDVAGYECSFVYCIAGRPLRACLYPARVSLFRTAAGRYVADGHAHRLQLEGRTTPLSTRILHDDRKPLARWLVDQNRYADEEVKKLLSVPAATLGWKDRLRKRILWAPWLTLMYCLFYKRLVLDGWPGILYALQRTYAELLLSLKLLDARLRGPTRRDNQQNDRAAQESAAATEPELAGSASSQEEEHLR